MPIIDPNLQWQYIQETSNLVDNTNYSNLSDYLKSQVNYNNYIQRNFGTQAEFEAYMKAKYGSSYKPLPQTPLSENNVSTKAVEVGKTTGGTAVLDAVESSKYTSTAEAGAVTATAGGVGVAVTADVAVPVILAGIGVGWASYELATPVWLAISNKIFGTDISLEQASEYSIFGIYKNDKFYFPEEVIQAVSDALYEADVYNKYNYSISSKITQTGVQEVTWTELSNADIQHYGSVMNIGIPSKMISYGRTEIHKHFPLAKIVQASVSVVETENVLRLALSFSTTLPNTAFITELEPGSKEFQAEDIPLTSATVFYYLNTDELSISFGEPYIGEVSSGINFDRVGTVSVDIVNELDEPGLTLLPDSSLNTTGAKIGVAYPDWARNAINISNYNPKSSTDPSEDTFNNHKFFPISLPGTYPLNPTEPFTPPSQEFSQEGETPNRHYVVTGSGIDNPTPPQTDTGDTPNVPPAPVIGGSSNALFTVYNPEMEQLNGLGNVLWSQSILEQIVRMFTNNPMDAIISLHVIYATPSIGGTKNIKLGYIDTGVPCPWVNKQYVKISCGTVTVPEYYGDARDYIGSTDVSIYLPFIGFRNLKTADIIGSEITVDYTVDVYTGTVLCNITVNKRGTTKVMYTFEGNCSVSIPLTGSDRSRQISSIGTMITGGAVGGVGGALLAGTGAIAGGGAQSSIQRTSNFSGNAGAMGIKKPYIIVNRNIPYDADRYNELYGYTANKTVLLGALSGYTRVKAVHVENCALATANERAEIERLLKTGVIL